MTQFSIQHPFELKKERVQTYKHRSSQFTKRYLEIEILEKIDHDSWKQISGDVGVQELTKIT